MNTAVRFCASLVLSAGIAQFANAQAVEYLETSKKFPIYSGSYTFFQIFPETCTDPSLPCQTIHEGHSEAWMYQNFVAPQAMKLQGILLPVFGGQGDDPIKVSIWRNGAGYRNITFDGLGDFGWKRYVFTEELQLEQGDSLYLELLPKGQYDSPTFGSYDTSGAPYVLGSGAWPPAFAGLYGVMQYHFDYFSTVENQQAFAFRMIYTPVPEPGALCLLAAGLATAGLLRIRRRR